MTRDGRVAFVTGASRGIGRAVALRLARDGFDVAVSALHSEALGSLVSEIEAMGRSSLAVQADVADRDAVFGAVRQTVEQLGGLDVLVTNAGVVQTQDIVDVTPANLHGIVDVNLFGTFWCVQAAAEVMIPARSGKMILASSISGHQGYEHFSAYCATKFAINGLTQSAAREFAKFGITVNAFCPGIVDTDMWYEIDAVLAPMKGKVPGEALEERAEDIALGRVETPEDVAGFVSYLASADADYMTGQSVVFDGGVVFR
jgi:meso-butanediol dehydrogenase/(S,S)-butanediol dehydrogenase/diacetyl reductase